MVVLDESVGRLTKRRKVVLSGGRLAVAELAGRDLRAGDLTCTCRPKAKNRECEVRKGRHKSQKMMHVHVGLSPFTQNLESTSTHPTHGIRHSPINETSAKLAQVLEGNGLVVVQLVQLLKNQ